MIKYDVLEKVIFLNDFLDSSDLYRLYSTNKYIFTKFSFDRVYAYVKKLLYLESEYRISTPPLDQVLTQYELLSRLRDNNAIEEDMIKRSYALKKCLSYTSFMYNHEKMPCYFCKVLDDKFSKKIYFTQGWRQISLTGRIITCDSRLEQDYYNFIDLTQCIYEEWEGKFSCVYHGTANTGIDFTICNKCTDKYNFCTVSGYAEKYGLKKKDLEKCLLQLDSRKINKINITKAQEYIFRYGNGIMLAPIALLDYASNWVKRKKLYRLDGVKKSLSYK